MSHMQKVSDIKLLGLAFKQVRLAKACSGSSNVVISQLTSLQQQYLEYLSKQLVQGKYRGASLKLSTSESQSQSPSIVFNEPDLVVHTAVAMVIQPILEQSFAESSWGYHLEHSCLDAVARVTEYREQGFTWVVTAGIRDLLDNICQKSLLKQLHEVIPDSQLIDLIDSCLFDKQVENKQLMFGHKVGFGIPQHSPLALLLAHFYLNQFDQNCLADKLACVRFADEFVILTHSKTQAEAVQQKVAKHLTACQLELNQEQTNIVNFEQGFNIFEHHFIGDVVKENKAAHANCITKRIEQDKKVVPIHSCRLKTLYLNQPGCMVSLVEQKLIINQSGQKLGEVPLAMLDLIVVMTRCQLNNDILICCLRHQIPVIICDVIGGFYGVLDNFSLCQPSVVAKQVEMQKLHKALPLVSSIISSKWHNSVATLKQLCSGQKQLNEQLTSYTEEIAIAQSQIKSAKTRQQITATESHISESYYQLWGILLPKHWGFKGRNRIAPKDPINALLNLGNALLFNNIHVLIKGRGLNESLGLLHTSDSKPNLVLDLLEIFRTIIVDTLVLKTILNGQFNATDFTQTNGIYSLSDNGRKRFIAIFEQKMQQQLIHPILGYPTDYRALINWQIRQFKSAICDDSNELDTVKL